jgi:hypothetical protein
MALQQYKELDFRADTLALIDTMNGVIRAYMAKGFKLTVRQLYYQLVARDVIPNNLNSYKRVTGACNDGRLAGLIDWSAIEDRTREFLRRQRWETGQDILDAATNSFHMDMWLNQDHRVFVIIEKEALVGVMERVCKKWDVPVLAARGYPSGTVLREFALEDIIPVIDGQRVVVLHLGDHDPSGIDMTRDLEERIAMFSETTDIELRRIALNMKQIQERNPPPNPAKTTDSRFKDYRDRFGEDSWELDALPPEYLVALVERNITRELDNDAWEKRHKYVETIRGRLNDITQGFEEPEWA